MKIALNKSIRDAQIRDSFNKESVVTMNDNEMFEYVKLLYTIQTETPRNVSKLHSLVVCGENELYLLNFEVLRSVELPINSDKKVKVQGFVTNDRPIFNEKRKPVTEALIEQSARVDDDETDVQENAVNVEEEGGKDNDNECSELENSRE